MKKILKTFIATVILSQCQDITTIQSDIETRFNKAQKEYEKALESYHLCETLFSKELCKQQSDAENVANARFLIYSFLVGCSEKAQELEYKNDPQAAMMLCLEETKKIMNMMPAEMQKIEKELNSNNGIQT